ncbi:TPA: DUF726 domain-containing protein [Escherichia coli]|nr:DUF726 domain-containing protein [Escherichia coli]
MNKYPVLIVVSGFLTENEISWLNRIEAGCDLDVRYFQWESANLLSILSSNIANKWGLYTLLPLRTPPLLSSISIPFKARQAWYNATKASVNNRDKLAQIINEIYDKEKRNVIIMGHSLGTRLINNALPYIKNDNTLLTISMAGATPITSYTENIMKMTYGSKMGHLNIYSEHDKVLNTIYPLVESVTPIGVREVRFRPARVINWKWDIGHTEYITSKRIDSLIHWLNVTCADLADPDVELTDDDIKLFNDIIDLANLTCHKNTTVPELISLE